LLLHDLLLLEDLADALDAVLAHLEVLLLLVGELELLEDDGDEEVDEHVDGYAVEEEEEEEAGPGGGEGAHRGGEGGDPVVVARRHEEELHARGPEGVEVFVLVPGAVFPYFLVVEDTLLRVPHDEGAVLGAHGAVEGGGGAGDKG